MAAFPNAEDPNLPDRPRHAPSDLRRARPNRAPPIVREASDVSVDDDPGYLPSPEEEELQRRLRRGRRRRTPGILTAGVGALVLAGIVGYVTLLRDDESSETPPTVVRKENPPPTEQTETPPQSTARVEPPAEASPPAPPGSSQGAGTSSNAVAPPAAPEPAQPPVEPPAQTRAEPSPPAPAPAARVNAPSPAEVADYLKRARDLIEVGDIGAARLLLERAAIGNDGTALFALGETYDPAMLEQWRVRGVRPNVERARTLYRRALDRGVAEAQARLDRLR